MRRVIRFACAVLVAGVPVIGTAQSWRTFEVSRQVRSPAPLTVQVDYGAGKFIVSPTAGVNLFESALRYDASHTEPLYKFDTTSRRLDVGIRRISGLQRIGRNTSAEFSLKLNTTVPLKLELNIGAAEADLDLSGLQIEDLSMSVGAADTRVRFDVANPLILRKTDLNVGAANVEISGLANANAERIDLSMGAGRVALDFSGEWRRDVELSVKWALGSVVIAVPRNVGVMVESSGFLQSISGEGLEKLGSVWQSTNWETATFKLRLTGSGALGSLEVNRTAR